MNEISTTRHLVVAIAPGELLDKVSILEIKESNILDPGKRANVRKELEILEAARRNTMAAVGEADALYRLLKQVNLEIWQTLEELNILEKAGNLGDRFVQLSVEILRGNARRAQIKREINAAFGSEIVEEKSID